MINMTLLFDILIYSVIWLWLSFSLVVIIYFLISKQFLESYFKKPHFSQTEIIALSGFPLCLMRTVMFMRLLGFPSSGKKRGLENAYRTESIWLCKLSRYSILSFSISASLFGLCLVISGVDMVLN